MEITFSTDRSLLNIPFIHEFLSKESYWAKGISFEIVERSIKNSLCFGVYRLSEQVGFARIITDYSTFAYLADVFIAPEHRGQGIAKALMLYIKKYPSLQGLRRWMLATADAHNLYRKTGFHPLGRPERFMEINMPDIYLTKN